MARKESKEAFKRRMEAAGTLKDFFRLRETIKADLQIQLGDWKLASSKAWELAMAEFPPAAVASVSPAAPPQPRARRSPSSASLEQAALAGQPRAKQPPPEIWAGKQKSSARADWDWVYQNIIIPEPDPETCPSAGAWGLWEWGRSNRADFYRVLSQFTAKLHNVEDLIESFADDGRRVIGILDRIERASQTSQETEAA